MMNVGMDFLLKINLYLQQHIVDITQVKLSLFSHGTHFRELSRNKMTNICLSQYIGLNGTSAEPKNILAAKLYFP